VKSRSKEEIQAFMEKVSRKGMVMTLTPLRTMCHRLGDPQKDLPVVHIAGTNGKGSVLSMISSVLMASGYRTGRFFSPQVFDEEPTITMQGCAPEETLYDAVMHQIIAEYENMESQGLETPTVFELEFLAALLCFSKAHCDIAVVECGMGGRDDATNVIANNAVCVFTPIALDHMQFLGNTVEEIARNKAGILTKDCIAVSAQQPESVRHVLQQQADSLGCKLEFCDAVQHVTQHGWQGQRFVYQGESYAIGLCGAHQCENAAVAIQALLALQEQGFVIPEHSLQQGLAQAVWHGRFECIMQSPLVILDGAHNPAGARTFVQSVDTLLAGKKCIYVFGMLQDKQYEEVAAMTAPRAAQIITFTPPSPRALDGRILAEICASYAPSVYAESPEAAVQLALQTAAGMGKDAAAICAFGSLYSLRRLRKSFYAMEFERK
jgi:dihydrofolate synthase/folylpolyglutamate synthase